MDGMYLDLSSWTWFGEDVGPEYQPDSIVDESLVVTGGLRPAQVGGPWIDILGHCEPIPVRYQSETVDIVAALEHRQRFPEPVTFETYVFCGRSFPFRPIQGGWLVGDNESARKFSIELDTDAIWQMMTDEMEHFRRAPNRPIFSYVLAGLAALSSQAVDATHDRLEELADTWARAFRGRLALSWDLEPCDADLALPRRIFYGEGPVTIAQIEDFLECSRTTLYGLRRALAVRRGTSTKTLPKTYPAGVVRREMLLPLLQSRQGRELSRRIGGLARRLGSPPLDIGQDIYQFMRPRPAHRR